jgi:glycosyltransferase involved in cell wall biosynthesis
MGMMKIATLCTFSTPELAKRYAYLNPNQAVIENCIDLEAYYHQKPNKHMPVTIGWAGSSTHNGDLDLLKGVLDTIATRHKNIVFVFANVPPGYFQCDRVVYLPPVSMDAYPELIAPFDIGLIPLQDHPFNHAKSDIKGLEYGARSIPFIASPSAAYKRLVKPGVNGLLAEKGKHWTMQLSRLIEDAELRKQLGAGARESSRTRDIRNNIHKWEEAYERQRELVAR